MCVKTYKRFNPRLHPLDKDDFVGECYLSLDRWKGEFDPKKCKLTTLSCRIARQTMENLIVRKNAMFRGGGEATEQYIEDMHRFLGRLDALLDKEVVKTFFWEDLSGFIHSLDLKNVKGIRKINGRTYCLNGRLDVVEIFKHRCFGHTFKEISEIVQSEKGIKCCELAYTNTYNSIVRSIVGSRENTNRMREDIFWVPSQT